MADKVAPAAAATTDMRDSRSGGWLTRNFPALTHRDFRYFWFGQMISLVGTWMQTASQAWLVLTLTDSPLKLGLVTAMQWLPVLVLSLFAGVFVDRFPKRTIVVITQAVSMLLAFALAAVVLTGRVQYWHIMLMATLLGVTKAIDNPARQSLMIELVGKDDLVNAVALNSTIVNGARIFGPALAGVMIGLVGTGWCFFINGISFIPVIWGLLQVRPRYTSRAKVRGRVLTEVIEGLRYIGSKPLLLRTAILAGMVNILAMNSNLLIPVFARGRLGLAATGYGFLMSAMGAGSVAGALLMALNSRRGARSYLLPIAALCNSVLLVIISQTRTPLTTAAVLVVLGLFNMLFSTNANSTMQLNADDQFRGRVMSVYFLVWGGTTPFGSLISGGIANHYGAPAAFLFGGVATALVVGITLLVGRRARAMSPAGV